MEFKNYFFLYVFMSFFDVFSGAPYGSDFLILTKGIIKKVPKRSTKKYLHYSNSIVPGGLLVRS